MEQGGAVVLANFAFHRLQGFSYQILRANSSIYLPPVTLDAINATHPLMAGVSTGFKIWFRTANAVTFPAGAKIVATWTGGIPAVLTQDFPNLPGGACSRRVDLNYYPVSSDAGGSSASVFYSPAQRDADGAPVGGRLMWNALQYAFNGCV